MKDLPSLRLQAEESTRYITFITRNDRILSYILHLVSLRVRIGHRRILIVFAQPFLTATQGLIGISVEEVETVGGLVQEDVGVCEGRAEENDVAVGVVGVAVGGGDGDYVAAELSG